MSGSVISRSLGLADIALKARKLRKASDAEVAARARALLVERMGRLRGLPQKMGQLLSMSADEDRAATFGKLTDRTEPLPFDEIAPVLRDAWDEDITRVVRSIETRGIAASLGQVHRATLMDGSDVAIKVQYPGIRKAAMADLRMLGWLSTPIGDLRRGFDMQGYRDEIHRDLDEELDYSIEAAHQRRFAASMRAQPDWIVPEVVESLSTQHVLVTRWIDGERIESVANWSPAARKALARTIVDGFFHCLFDSGLIHADPHAGNYRFQFDANKPRVVLYDFGSMYRIPPEHRLAILKLIEMTMAGRGDPFKPLVSIRFNPDLLGPIRDKLAAVCGTIFEPFANPGAFDVRRWNRRERITHILGDDKWNFRMSGPPWLVFVLRAFHGLVYYLDHLDAPVSWSNAVRRHLDANATALAAIDVTPEPDRKGAFERQARHLRIRVMDHGREKVLLKFPASSVDRLDDFMDEDLRERIVAQGHDLGDIVRSVRQSAYEPQTLLEIDDAATAKSVRVWLE